MKHRWLLAAVLVGILAAGFMFRPYVEEADFTVELHDVRSLDVRGFNGRIEVRRWDGDHASFHAVKEVRAFTTGISKRRAQRIIVDVERQGADVVVSARDMGKTWLMGSASVRFHVMLPEAWSGPLRLHTSNGNVTVEGHRGPLHVRTSNGVVRAEDVHGAADLRTSNGRIEVAGQTGELRVRTSNGRLELHGLDSVVDAESSNGRINVSGVLRGSGRMRTSNGAMRLDLLLEEGAAYEARTSNGAVDLILTDPDVSLELRTSNSSIVLATEILATELERGRVAGRIGGGAASLSVRTSNGRITVERRESRVKDLI